MVRDNLLKHFGPGTASSLMVRAAREADEHLVRISIYLNEIQNGLPPYRTKEQFEKEVYSYLMEELPTELSFIRDYANPHQVSVLEKKVFELRKEFYQKICPKRRLKAV